VSDSDVGNFSRGDIEYSCSASWGQEFMLTIWAKP
jgi:hypothetical protein